MTARQVHKTPLASTPISRGQRLLHRIPQPPCASASGHPKVGLPGMAGGMSTTRQTVSIPVSDQPPSEVVMDNATQTRPRIIAVSRKRLNKQLPVDTNAVGIRISPRGITVFFRDRTRAVQVATYFNSVVVLESCRSPDPDRRRVPSFRVSGMTEQQVRTRLAAILSAR